MNLLQPDHIPLLVALMGAVALWQIDFYIRRKLGKDHDPGFLFFAAAYLVWTFMAIYEINTGKPPSGAASHIFSFLNTTALLLGLSYIKEGPFRWVGLFHQRPLATIGGVAAVFVTLLAFSGEDTQLLSQVEILYSMLVLSLLCLSGAAALYHRGLPFLSILFILTLLAFVELEYEAFLNIIAADYQYSKGFDPLRLASRFGLLIPLLGLALSWLGEQLSKQAKSGAKLRFLRGANQHCLIELNCQRNGILKGLDFTVDMSNNIVLFDALEQAAAAQVETGYFRTNTFTNWTTNRRQFTGLVMGVVQDNIPGPGKKKGQLEQAVESYLFSSGPVAGTASFNWPGLVIQIEEPTPEA